MTRNEMIKGLEQQIQAEAMQIERCQGAISAFQVVLNTLKEGQKNDGPAAKVQRDIDLPPPSLPQQPASEEAGTRSKVLDDIPVDCPDAD